MEYTVQESTRAKSLRITVLEDGSVILTKPKRMPMVIAKAWIARKRAWIVRMQEGMRTRREKHGTPVPLPKLRKGTKAYKEARESARMAVTACVEQMAREYGFAYTSIAIRDQKTRWGSCSAKGALSFNYRAVYLPPELLAYLVAHELAHTKHHNHSPRFWAEVERMIPNAKGKRKELGRYRF